MKPLLSTYRVKVRPNYCPNLVWVVASFFENIIHVLFDFHLDTCGSSLLNNRLRAVPNVFPGTQVEQNGIELAGRGLLIVFDEKAIRDTALDCQQAWHVRLHKSSHGKAADVKACVYDTDAHSMLRGWNIEIRYGF